MHSLTIGSKIVGANGQLDTVTNFIHRDENIKSTFLRLQTPRGALELSPNHLLFARNGSSTQSVLARDVRIGTTLLHRDGEAMVTSIDAFTDDGAYAPMTWSGELEVNGFAVSAYAQYPSHAAAHAVMYPLNYLPANTDGVHWYAKAWQKLYETAVQVMGGH